MSCWLQPGALLDAADADEDGRRTTTLPTEAASRESREPGKIWDGGLDGRSRECPIGESGVPPPGITEKRIKRGPIRTRKPARLETPSGRLRKEEPDEDPGAT